MTVAIRARIDEKTRDEAAAVLDAMGLTDSDAFRLTMVRTAAEKRLSFDPLAPNEKTVEAWKPPGAVRWSPSATSMRSWPT